MKYVNDYDIETARRWGAANAAIQSAVQTVSDLKDWTNSNSDGWAYWPKPVRAAGKLIELVWGNGTNEHRERAVREVSAADVAKALLPIKSFRTRAVNGTLGAWQRNAMPWFPITASERDEVARKARDAERAAHADSVRRLAAKLEPVIRANPAGHADQLALKLAETAVAGW